MDKRGAIAVIAFVYTFRVGAWPIEKEKKERRPLWSALHIFKLVSDLRKRKKNMTNKKVMLFSVIYDLLWVVGVFYVEQVRQE